MDWRRDAISLVFDVRTCFLRILQVMYVMQVRVIMVVMQDAFQIGAVQHCHGVRPRSRSMHTFTKLFHWHQHVSLSHHFISGDSTALAHTGTSRERRRSVCDWRRQRFTASQMLWRRHIHFRIPPRSIRRSIGSAVNVCGRAAHAAHDCKLSA